MAKVSFQDVVPPGKRSIRNISINSAKRSRAQTAPAQEEPKIIQLHKEVAEDPIVEKPITKTNPISFSDRINQYTPNPTNSFSTNTPIPPKNQNYYFEENGKNKPNKKFLVFGVFGVVIIAFVAFIMTILSSATVTITPKKNTFDTNLSLKISSDGSTGIKYELLKLTKSKSVSVQAKGEEMVEKKASGKIIVYNNFSEEPQRLISRTRFETSSGLIYRIPESITVPGRKTVDGKVVPGSLEVEVFADEAGEKYNIDKTDFTIPGFKTDKERYANFYAKSSTEMAGGFIGKMKTVVDSDKNSALSKLETEIKSELEKEIKAQIPDGLVLLNDSIFYSNKELPQKDEGSSVSLSLEVTSHALLLPKEILSQTMVKSLVGENADWQNIDAKIADFSALGIGGNTENPLNAGSIDLNIVGQSLVEANIDNNLVIESLVGSKQKDMSSILSKFPGIIGAKAAIRPIWKKSFPENPSKIYINIEGSAPLDSNS